MSLAVSDTVIWHESNGSVSLYHVESGEFHTLNETGSKIWSIVLEHGEQETVLSKLVEEFAGDNAALAVTIVTDTKAFLSRAIAEGWIEVKPS